jgi:hypothetical protein
MVIMVLALQLIGLQCNVLSVVAIKDELQQLPQSLTQIKKSRQNRDFFIFLCLVNCRAITFISFSFTTKVIP